MKGTKPYCSVDMYNDYIKEFKPDNPFYIDAKTYREIQKKYYNALMDKLIFHAYVLKLPYRLGFFGIIKRRVNFNSKSQSSIDWVETKKLGRYIRHVNDHSANFRFLFVWSKVKCMVINKNVYRLVMSRTNKRLLAKAIKEDRVDFPEHKY